MLALGWYLVGDDVPMVRGKDDDTHGLASRIDELNAWFLASGGRGVARVQMNGTRCGLFATSPLEVNDIYISVPMSLVISRSTALHHPQFGESLRRIEIAASRRLPPELVRVMILCYALLLRDDPYTRALPRDFSHHPLMWHTFRGTGFLREALAQARQSLRFFVTACTWFKDSQLPFFSRCQYAWAYMCFLTRCIVVVDLHEWCFVPMVDFTNCQWSDKFACSRTTLDGPASAVMRTYVPVAPGCEIFENYGWSNFDYFMAHGFVLPPFPQDALVLPPRKLRTKGPYVTALFADGCPTTWQPRLCRGMTFGQPKPGAGPFGEEWAWHRNFALHLSLALILDTDKIPFSPELTCYAKPSHISRSWTYLAEVCRDLLDDITQAQKTPSDRPPGGDAFDYRPTLATFYENQAQLAVDLLAEFETHERTCLEPPPYSA